MEMQGTEQKATFQYKVISFPYHSMVRYIYIFQFTLRCVFIKLISRLYVCILMDYYARILFTKLNSKRDIRLLLDSNNTRRTYKYTARPLPPRQKSCELIFIIFEKYKQMSKRGERERRSKIFG